MRICDDLRHAVLQAAIQGKLTKQLPEDGNSEDLLKEIAKEKSQLIKEGKIKKEKVVLEVLPDEEPFDIPENWKWVRLGNLTNKLVDGTHKTPKYTSEGVKFISVKNISSGYLSLANTKYISEKEHKELYERCNPEKGDILLSKVGTTGVPAIIDTDEEFSLFVSVALLKFSKKYISNKFLYFLLLSPLVQQQAKDNTRGVGNKNWVLDSISNTLLVLPPLAEQHRIVARVEELMARIDDLEKTETELEILKAAFPGDMKAALLQAAMQGKLTEQLPEDGDAADLLKQIMAEKAKLIKEGKIKKEKPLPVITSDEMPFDIPENWQWVRLGSIGTWGSGATPSKTNINYYKNGTIPWLLTGDLNDGFIDDVPGRITELALKETSVKLNHKGAVLIAMYGATIGKLGIINTELTTNQACCACHPFEGVYNRYLFYFLMYHKPFFIEKAEGGAQPNISREKIVKTLCPLPPLAEQKRIVEKLDKLLPLCDGLVEE